MKIITVTSQKALNYGAVLQAYALQKTLINLGYDNYLLDFPQKSENIYAKINFKMSIPTLRNILLNIFAFFNKEEIKTFRKEFLEFQKNYFNSTIPYNTIDEIKQNPPESDVYLSGSDQVFAYNQSIRDIRFLSFGSRDIKRYSYAASIDLYNMNDEQIKYYKDKLGNFNKISLREPRSVDYIQSVTGFKCEYHLDPSFLLSKEQWSDFAKKPRDSIPDKYILCFPLLGNKNTQRVVNKIKKESGYPIVCLQTKSVKTVKADHYIFDASPREFLGLFMNADYIVTTSFHGTVFSIIFEKNFYTLIKSYKPERMVNLLNLLNIPERIVTDVGNLSFSKIDYAEINKILESEIKKSYEYLKSIG